MKNCVTCFFSMRNPFSNTVMKLYMKVNFDIFQAVNFEKSKYFFIFIYFSGSQKRDKLIAIVLQ